MTNRNELERLLAAATEGPWAVCTDATGDTFIASMTDSAETVCEMGAMDTGEGQAQLEADAALICFLRNNAQHYLSLMDEVERLRGELAAMKARGDRLAEALITLSELSSYLGAGAGDDTTTVEQFNQRIRWGIDHIGVSYRNRAAQVVEECSKKFGTTWGQVKRAILEDTCLEPATLIRDEARDPEIEEAADRITTLEAELAAMKARGDRLAEAGKNLLSACYEADGYEELPEQIDGSLLDAMSLAIWPEIWTDEQVAALNAYQARDDSHPFTCGSDNRGDEAHRAVQDEDGGDLGQLVATRQGWICPACDYRQFWAHDFMLAQALTEWRDQ